MNLPSPLLLLYKFSGHVEFKEYANFAEFFFFFFFYFLVRYPPINSCLNFSPGINSGGWVIFPLFGIC